MRHLIQTLFENLFPKYKAVECFERGTGKDCWAIGKRLCLFFYPLMTHTKTVEYEYVTPGHSHEILMFYSEEEVESEIDRLSFGYNPIIARTWKAGKMVEEKYALPKK